MTIDPIALSQKLIACPSVTPLEAGALDVLEKYLKDLGFDIIRKVFSQDGYDDVENLYASYGSGSPHFNFAGHLDVVPTGDLSAWQYDPFSATIQDGKLYGRGAADMKTGVACFVSAISSFIKEEFEGKISLLITMDEEGPAVNGIVKMLPFLKEKGEVFDACLLGEPSNPDIFGEYFRIGRRGTLSAAFTIEGKQGHVAYPEKADNPITRLMKILSELKTHKLDDGNEFFPPSNLEVTGVYCDNKAENVIPNSCRAQLNIRYNTEHTAEELKTWIEQTICAYASDYQLTFNHNGDPFVSQKGSSLVRAIEQGVALVLGKPPKGDTGGGTSDGRFIKDYCDIAEFGIVGDTNHQINEHVKLDDIIALKDCYLAILNHYFNKESA